MSTVISNKHQIGQSATATQNFTIQTPNTPDGTLEIRRGNASAPGGVVAKVNADGGFNSGGPVFSAYGTAAQSVPNSVFTKVNCETEEFDTNSNYDTATSRFQPTVSGYYVVCGQISFGTTTGTTSALATIYKNGVEAKRGTTITVTSGQTITPAVSTVIFFNGSTDYAELYAFQNGGSSLSTVKGTAVSYFQGYLARAA